MFAGPMDRVFTALTKFGLREAAEKYTLTLPTVVRKEPIVVTKVPVPIWVYVGGGVALLYVFIKIFKRRE